MTTKYTREHEWVRIEGETGIVGITGYAEGQLGDIVFVELPAVGKILDKGEQAAVVESVKAASEVYSPVSGKVVEVNADLEDSPGNVNEDATGAGWFFTLEISDAGELDDLMDEAAYKEYIKGIE
ncbi:MAG: glycine cleavage system protein H [Rhodospirillales bacterium RIFCSPLOWO2_12_FULL_58_28]|nr:MAG: glycine cleavage system protein H [Rhodospirillales bacterium RIFCSPLOWO2_02_FULL_58_16]OHC79423.1 MAG: glycine cleavage system protein H [Rhodospirillales bacterium RIFCSPLOWO2_12_FULL_58_28]